MPSQKILPDLIDWYRENARDIVWRRPGVSPWGILLSEVMSQQTQVSRVEPAWEAWLERWPTPADFAAATPAEVLRAWGRLGYPRRALRLLECARAIVERHGGEVPSDVDALLQLPGIGEYTARAIAAFAYRQRVPVVDTNVRRVVSRAIHGEFTPGNPKKRDLSDVEKLLPRRDAHVFSVALMELGALVCTSRSPKCDECPIICAWVESGRPEPAPTKKRTQRFAGTDRQVRGIIMAKLREAEGPVPQADIDVLWPDDAQRSRALFSLLDDGLAEQTEGDLFQLPTSSGPGS